MLSQCQRNLPLRMLETDVRDYNPISITPVLSKVFEKIIARKLSIFLDSNSLLSPSHFSYPRGLGTRNALLPLSHHL